MEAERGGPKVAGAGAAHADEELHDDVQTEATARSRDEDGAPSDGGEPLLADSDSETLQSRWREVQARFVDEPQRSVEEADGLVREAIEHLQRTFSEERERLERVWAGGDDVSTEDLRVALTRYRSFFNRLLST